jgi:hypothetical protein
MPREERFDHLFDLLWVVPSQSSLFVKSVQGLLTQAYPKRRASGFVFWLAPHHSRLKIRMI